MGEHERILLADDSSSVHESMGLVLEDDGHQVIHVYSVEEVKRTVDRADARITMAIIDARMPREGDGLEAATYIRSRRPKIRIISLSVTKQSFGDLNLEKGESIVAILAAIKSL